MTIFELINSRIAVPVTDQASVAYLTALAVVEQEVQAGAWTTVDLGASYGISSNAAICKRSGNTITAVSPRAGFTVFENDCLHTAFPNLLTLAISNGTVASAGGTTLDRPGVIGMSCGSLANSGFNFITNLTTISLGGGEKATFIFYPALARATSYSRMGFIDSYTTVAPSDGAYIQFVGNATGVTISGRCAKGGATSTTGTAYAAAINAWYTGTIEVNADASLVTFTIYASPGVQLWQDTLATNIPTGVSYTGFGFMVAESSTAGAALISNLDYFRLEINRVLSR